MNTLLNNGDDILFENEPDDFVYNNDIEGEEY